MVHLRSPEAKLRREQTRKARQVMYDYAFNDFMNGDVVNLLNAAVVQRIVSVSFGGVPVSEEVVPCAAEPGCILSDPYGRGAFQK